MAYLSPQDMAFLENLPLNPIRSPLRKLVNLMCKECIYDKDEPGGWRQQAQACTCSNCPLHKARPRATGLTAKLESRKDEMQ